MFSGQVDTTQDITSKDQCSIIARYVTDQCEASSSCGMNRQRDKMFLNCEWKLLNGANLKLQIALAVQRMEQQICKANI